MPREKRYYVYVLASITRILQHKSGETDGFTRRYRVHRLVYYETFRYVNNDIARETEIKKWRRDKKIALIERENPTWEDLAAEWGKPTVMQKQIPPPPRYARPRNDKTQEVLEWGNCKEVLEWRKCGGSLWP